MYNREKCIKQLILDDLDTQAWNGNDVISSILEFGFKGYNNFTDDEIMQEMKERDISYLFGENDDV
jgi:hypothetical protein